MVGWISSRLKVAGIFLQQIDQQAAVSTEEWDTTIRWAWWEDSREIWRGHAFERSETLLPRLTQKVNASEKEGDEKWTSVAGAAVPTPSKPGSDMKVLCRAASLLLSKKKSGYGGGTASGCVLDAPPQPVCHWLRWSVENNNGGDGCIYTKWWASTVVDHFGNGEPVFSMQSSRKHPWVISSVLWFLMAAHTLCLAWVPAFWCNEKWSQKGSSWSCFCNGILKSFCESVFPLLLLESALNGCGCPPCSVLASLERRRVKTSQGDGCLFFCFMKLPCCPRPTSSDCMLSSQWSLHDSPRVNAFQTIMPPLEHYNHVCGSFFSGSSHVSFFLSGILCVIPPMCDNAWRFLPSSMWDLGA